MNPFRPDGSFKRSRGALPHWTQDDVIYFVTFRLADSLPKKAMDDWSDRRRAWITSRGLNPATFQSDQLSNEDQKKYLRRFGATFHDMLDDCHGECLLKKSANAKTVASALKYFEGERYSLGTFVVMPNHVHSIIAPRLDFQLSRILQSLKSHTAKEINRLENRSGQLWQRESYDHIVRNASQLARIEQYISENPKKANLKEGEFFLRA